MFGTCILGVILLIILYLGTESWVWHHNHRIELLFWTGIATVVSVSFFFAHDGPGSFIADEHPAVAGVLCVLFCLFVRRVYRRVSNVVYLTRFDAIASGAEGHEDAAVLSPVDNPHFAEFQRVLSALDYSSHAVRLIQRGTVVKSQRSLLKLLASVPPESLNSLIVHTNLPRLLESVQEAATDVLRCVAGRRLSDLGISAKATLLDALQKIGIPRSERERYIRDVILSVKGQQLLRLKAILDGRGTWHNLFKLVYMDVLTSSVRGEILTHLAAESLRESAAARAEEGAADGASETAIAPELKVLSDIDDTLYASGGPPAGLDKRFPKKTVYPGVLALYRELDAASDAASPSTRCFGCNLVFLSARPHSYKGLSESASYRRFRRMVADGTLHAMPTLLSGDAGSAAALMKNFAPIGRKKHSNFVKYARLYPEKSFVFFGDSGQGDVLAGELMLGTHPQSVLAVLIHDLGNVPDEARRPPAKHPKIHYFLTYVGAAATLFELGILSASSLRAVACASVSEFHAIAFKQPKLRELCLANLVSDCERVNEFVRKGAVPGPPFDARVPPAHAAEDIIGRTMRAAQFLRRKSYSVLESTAGLFVDTQPRRDGHWGGGAGTTTDTGSTESDTDVDGPSTSASARPHLRFTSMGMSTDGSAVDSTCDESDTAADSADDYAFYERDGRRDPLEPIVEATDGATTPPVEQSRATSHPAGAAAMQSVMSAHAKMHGGEHAKGGQSHHRKKHARTASDGSALLRRAVVANAARTSRDDADIYDDDDDDGGASPTNVGVESSGKAAE